MTYDELKTNCVCEPSLGIQCKYHEDRMPKAVPTSTNERLVKAIILLSLFAIMVYLAGM